MARSQQNEFTSGGLGSNPSKCENMWVFFFPHTQVAYENRGNFLNGPISDFMDTSKQYQLKGIDMPYIGIGLKIIKYRLI